MKQLLLIWFCLALPFAAVAQVCGLEDTLWINPDASHIYTIEIAGLVNDNFANPAQGLCGVEIEFVHQFVENLEIWLTSPGGTSIQLIGPNTDDPSAFTFFARWDIEFVPCDSAAAPDLGYAAQWNNNQPLNYVSGGRYLGTYFPFSGCLEDFNSGPVNGTWTITVENNPSPFYGGAILDFRLIFCDDRGVDCCFADPGLLLPVTNLEVCLGADTLSNLDISPFYPGRMPDSTIFGYFFAIARNDTIIALDSLVDLSNAVPGLYEVCGLSYELATADGIPPISAQLTIDSLRANLDGFEPDFCGALTSSCAQILVSPPPDTTFLQAVRCFGDSVVVGQTAYYNSGIYHENIDVNGGCDSIVQLQLQILPQATSTIQTTICEGDTIFLGNEAYFQSGIFTQSFLAVTGCDSTITLNLTVLETDTVHLDTAICIGDTLFIGLNAFWLAGSYSVPLVSVAGCDSIVQLQLDIIEVEVEIVSPDTLTCTQAQVSLEGQVIQGGNMLQFSWMGPGIVSGENTSSCVVNAGGEYTLVIVQGVFGCTDTASITVEVDTITPISDAGTDQTITCQVNTVSIGGSNTTTGSDIRYNWQTTNGQFLGPTNQPITTVDDGGVYVLIVENIINGCADTSDVLVLVNQAPPFADAGEPFFLNCEIREAVLDGSLSASEPLLQFQWNGPCLIGDADTIVTMADCPGLYTLTVYNPENGCVGTDSVFVLLSQAVAFAITPDTVRISCETGNALIDASSSVFGVFEWEFNGQPASFTEISPLVSQPGVYVLKVNTLALNCPDQDTTVVVLDCLIDAEIAPVDTILTCTASTAMLFGSAITSGGGVQFSWSGPPGCIIGDLNNASVQAVCAGSYQLIATSSTTGIADTAFITLVTDQIPPLADAGPIDTITCAQPFGILNGSNSSVGTRYRYEWTDANGQVVGQSIMDTVFQQGGYFLEVTDTLNGCTAVDFVTISRQTDPPTINFGNAIFPCDRDSFLLRAFADPPNLPYRYLWTGPGLLSPNDAADVWIDTTGTYRLELTNTITGCGAAANIVVTRPNCGPCLSITTPDTVTCLQLSVQLQASFCEPCPGCSFSWEVISGEIISGSGTLTPEVRAGSYRIIATDTFGISNSRILTVPADNSPPPADAGPDRILTCADTIVLIGGSGSAAGTDISFLWFSDTGILPVSPNTPLTEVNRPGNYWLQVRNDLTGCFAQDTVSVDLDTIPPVADAGPDMQITCTSSFAIPDGSSSSLGNNFTYLWTTSGIGFIAAGDTTLNPIVNTPGIYRLTVTNQLNGCFSGDSMRVTLSTQLPVVPDIPDRVLTCRDSVITLYPDTIDTLGFSFQWCKILQGNIVADCTPGLNRFIQTPGLYRFEVTDNATGCRNVDFVNVTTNYTPPQVDAGIPPGILNCTQPSLQLSGSVESGGLPVFIEWFGLNSNIPEPFNSLQPVVTMPDLYFLRAIREDNGCIGLDSVRIDLNDNFPEASAGVDTSLTCLNTQIRLQAAAQTIGAPVEWLWTTSDGQVLDGAQTPAPLVNRAGTYILIITDPASGCIATDTVSVGLSINPPEIIVDAPDGLTLNCRFNSVELDASQSNAQTGAPLSFLWSGEPGTVQGNPDNARVRVNGIGFYRIIVTDTENGCADTTLVQIGGNFEAPIVSLAAPLPLTCSRNSVDVVGSSLPSGNFLEYTWLFPSGDTIPGSTPTLQAIIPGLYKLLVKDSRNGCTGMANTLVGIDTIPPRAIIAPVEPLDCGRPRVVLNGMGSLGRSPLGYRWSGPVDGITSGAGAPVAEAGIPGIYFLIVTEAINGCTDTTQVEVEQVTAPITDVDITVESPACLPTADGIIRINSILGGTAPFIISFQGGGFGQQRQFFNLAPGTYAIRIQDAATCTFDTSVVILAPPLLTLDLGPDTLILLGDSVNVLALTNLPVTMYRWWVGGQLITNNSEELSLRPEANTSVRARVENDDGCTAEDWIEIFVEKTHRFFVPDAFSPNGDGHNDRFTIFSGSGVKRIQSLRIFDRWGQLVFLKGDFVPNDPEQGWDGMLDGRLLNPAVFLVVAEIELFDGKTVLYKGELVLLR